MSIKPENPPAFACVTGTPETNGTFQQGMTLRDYFANGATEKDIEPYINARPSLPRGLAKYAYADEMLKARES